MTSVALWLFVALLALLALLALAGWLSWTAQRLDRLHHRLDVARASLDTHLQRRSGTVLELAAAEALDPASRLILLDAARRARAADPVEQEAAESGLSQVLRAVLDDAPATTRAELDELADACVKVELARRFHNDAVVAARALRSRRRVRWFRLAGRAGEPRTVDLDDVPPRGWGHGAGVGR